MREGPQSYPHPVIIDINDQTLILVNFEGLVLLSPSDIIWELCELIMIRISQGIDWYKVPVAGKNGKLNETIEVSALWSNGEVCRLELRLRTDSDILNMSVLVLIIKPS